MGKKRVLRLDHFKVHVGHVAEARTRIIRVAAALRD